MHPTNTMVYYFWKDIHLVFWVHASSNARLFELQAELREFEVMRQDRSEKGSIASDEPSSGEDEG